MRAMAGDVGSRNSMTWWMFTKECLGRQGCARSIAVRDTTKKIGRRWQVKMKLEYGRKKAYEGQNMEG